MVCWRICFSSDFQRVVDEYINTFKQPLQFKYKQNMVLATYVNTYAKKSSDFVIMLYIKSALWFINMYFYLHSP